MTLEKPPAVDPFGLWQAPPAFGPVDRTNPDSPAEMVSFGLPGSGGGGSANGAGTAVTEAPVAVWQLPLTSGPAGSADGQQELDRRAAQLRSINSGLDSASVRAESLLAVRAAARDQAGEAVSFSVGGMEAGGTGHPFAQPEASLASALDALEPSPTGEVVSYGLGETVSQLAGQAGINWEDLRGRLDGLMDSVNRQLLHFAWVDTTLDGLLVARTTVDWGGDLTTLWQPGLFPEYSAAHCRSLSLAMASRAANLRTVLTVSKIAGKIALAVATPLGPLQAMSLGWQFVQEVVMPLLKQKE